MMNRRCVLPPKQSCLLLGPRQTGKSMLVTASLPPKAWIVDLLERVRPAAVKPSCVDCGASAYGMIVTAIGAPQVLTPIW